MKDMASITQEQTLERPIFIVGPLRSGSTLLRLLMDHHPNINLFGEFEGAVSQAIGNSWPKIEDYHAFVHTDRMMQMLDVSIDPSLDYVPLVHSFMEQLYQKKRKPVIGAAVHSRMDLLPLIWPQARFIHLLRDPRDVARSCIGMGWVGNVYEGAKYWMRPELHRNILYDQVPESQQLTIHYESLVSDPVTVLTTVCNFLDLDYDSAMLEIEQDTTYSAPSQAYVNQWQQKLTDREITWIEYQCHDLMQKRGYELSGFPVQKPSLFELLRIKLQNRSYRIHYNIQRWGFTTWCLHVLTKRLGPTSLRDKIQMRIDRITTAHLK